MYYCVSYSVDRECTIYSGNIAAANTKEAVINYYKSEYPDSKLIVSEAFDWEVEAAKGKGMPIVTIKWLIKTYHKTMHSKIAWSFLMQTFKDIELLSMQ